MRNITNYAATKRSDVSKLHANNANPCGAGGSWPRAAKGDPVSARRRYQATEPHNRQQLGLFSTPADHIAALHTGVNACAVAVKGAMSDGREWWQHTYEIETLLAIADYYAGQADAYISQNAVEPGKPRRIDNISYLNGHFVDVDCYKLAMTPERAAAEAANIIANYGLPRPTLTINSGRGLYLVWSFLAPQKLPKNYTQRAEQLAQWAETQGALTALFEPIGADSNAQDAARVLRIVGSINSKSGTPVECIETGDRLTRMQADVLREVATEAAGYIEQREAKRTRTISRDGTPGDGHDTGKRKATSTGTAARTSTARRLTVSTLSYKRWGDLKILAKLRGGRLEDGRNSALFILATIRAAVVSNPRQLLAEVTGFAEDYLKPDPRYTPEAIERSLSSVIERATAAHWQKARFKDRTDKRYWLTNERIIEMLAITPEEQLELATIIGKAEKARRRTEARRNAGVKPQAEHMALCTAKRTEKAAAGTAKAEAMKAEGWKVTAIAKELGVTRETVRRWLNGK